MVLMSTISVIGSCFAPKISYLPDPFPYFTLMALLILNFMCIFNFRHVIPHQYDSFMTMNESLVYSQKSVALLNSLSKAVKSSLLLLVPQRQTEN